MHLLADCRLELHDQFSRYPAAVLHFDALGLGPFAYLGGVQPACRTPARAAGRPPGSAAGPPGRTHVAGQGIPQLLRVPGVQVDLVFRAVQAETDGSLGGTAVKVIDEQGLYFLSRGRSSLSLISGALVHAVQAGQAYRHAGGFSRCRPAPADAAPGRNRVSAQTADSELHANRTHDVYGPVPPGLVNLFTLRSMTS